MLPRQHASRWTPFPMFFRNPNIVTPHTRMKVWKAIRALKYTPSPQVTPLSMAKQRASHRKRKTATTTREAKRRPHKGKSAGAHQPILHPRYLPHFRPLVPYVSAWNGTRGSYFPRTKRNQHKMSRAENSRGPLAGHTVVDLSRALAGPHAGMMLADLGARVIKVENPGTGGRHPWLGAALRGPGRRPAVHRTSCPATGTRNPSAWT